MNSSEAAEAIVKMSLEGIEVAARITGTGAEKIAVLLYTMAKDQKTTKGKTKLNNMLKSGSPLQIFSLKEDELKKFHEESKKYGVLYTALIDKKHPDTDGLVDIMVRSQDAPKVNHIIDRFKLSTVDIASIKSEVEKDKIEEMVKDAKERGVEVKSDVEKLADDIMSKPIQKETSEVVNPNVAKTEKSPLSEPSSKSKSKCGVVSKNKKPSVRKELKEIANELNDKKQENTHEKEKNVIDTDKAKKVEPVNIDNNIVKGSAKNKKGKER